jgi:hypothetical protein
MPPTKPNLQALPGKSVGILATNVSPLVAREGRRIGPNAVGFASGRTSYRVVYVPTEAGCGTALSLPVGPTGDEWKRFPDLAQLTAPGLKALGLEGDYHLVEIEVNDSAGAPGVDTFVATKITPLDGSRAIPLRVGPKVTELAAAFEKIRTAKGATVRDALEAQRKKVLGDKKPTGPVESVDLTYVTWLPDTEELSVEFRHVVADGLYSYSSGTVKAGEAPAKTRYGTTYGVEVVGTYTVSKEGKILKEEFDLRPFLRATPPPQTNLSKK